MGRPGSSMAARSMSPQPGGQRLVQHFPPRCLRLSHAPGMLRQPRRRVGIRVGIPSSGEATAMSPKPTLCQTGREGVVQL